MGLVSFVRDLFPVAVFEGSSWGSWAINAVICFCISIYYCCICITSVVDTVAGVVPEDSIAGGAGSVMAKSKWRCDHGK